MWDRGQHEERRRPDELPGVIDTIGLAYTRLLARPWIVLGPVLLDLYLWLGLKVTAGPLMLKIGEQVRPIERIGASTADFIDRQEGFNLAELLSFELFTVRMPTFFPSLASDEPVRLQGWRPEFGDGPWWLLAALVPLLLLAGYTLGSAFLLAAGDVARGSAPRFDARAWLSTSYRLVLWLLASIGLLALLTWPLIVAQGVFIYAGSPPINILSFLMLFPAGVGFVLFFFSVFAIVLDGATAGQAFRSSYRVVRADSWQALAFIVSFMIVTGGFPFFWRVLATVPPGTLIAVVGNAFVSTGMIVAGMIYYEDRAAVVDLSFPATEPGTA